MFAFFSLLFNASSLLPFFPFFLSFHPSYLPTFHLYDTIPRTVHTILCDVILLYMTALLTPYQPLVFVFA